MSAAGPVLVCAATAVEAQACRLGLRGVERRVEVLQTGMGVVAAAEALRRRLETAPRPRWLISSGFAGSRDESVNLGAWLFADSLRHGTLDVPVSGLLDGALAQVPLPARRAEFVTVDLVVGAGEGAQAGVAVDMESAALGRLAYDVGIPFDVLRVVSDTVVQPVPDALAELSQAVLKKEALARWRGMFWSATLAAQSPRAMLGFVLRSALLPRVLAEGWRHLGRGLG